MSEPFETHLKDRRSGRAPDYAPMLLPELRGRRIAWAGVESAEPMLRGCDQRELLERLAAAGIRHLIVPLNGRAEDTCIFARKHVESGGASGGGALYDLERRDEGAFTRLKFLLETARTIGVLIGISLFDAAPSAEGPLSRGGNLQGLSLSQSPDAKHSERLRAVMDSAADWVCSTVRGFHAVWIETFRNSTVDPGAHERALCARIAEILSRHREDLSPMRLGPWVALRREGMLPEKYLAQTAPFGASTFVGNVGLRDDFAGLLRRIEGEPPASHPVFAASHPRSPQLLRFPEGAVEGPRSEWLWRVFLRGYWPVVSLPLHKSRDSLLWESVASLARFAVAWAGRGALRPFPELLAPMQPDLSAFAAAEDGTGRYFASFSSPAQAGLRLALPPGFYRYYWISPVAARVIDRGDGVEGGECANVPGCADAEAKLLVIEQSELPDSLSVW